MSQDVTDSPNVLESPDLFLVAGEPSGDMHAANLIKAVRARRPRARFAGLGGPLMEQAGCALQQNMMTMSWMGFARAIFGLPRILRLQRRTLAYLDEHRPQAVVLVDFPGFNILLAGHLRKRGIPVIYYISPQIWAWAPWRIRKIRKRVSRMLVLFPFEEELYRKAGVPVDFVGHPLFEHLDSLDLGTSLPDSLRDPSHPRTIGLLPGSRAQVVKRSIPVMFRAAERIHQQIPETHFLVSCQQDDFASIIQPWIDRASFPVRIVKDSARPIMKHAELCLVASGTATLELAHFGTPMVVLYRIPPHGYLLGKVLLTSKYFCLVNIVAGREVVPELLLWRDDAARVADHALRILTGPGESERMKEDLAQVRRLLASPGAADRAAQAVLNVVDAPRDGHLRTGRPAPRSNPSPGSC